MSAHQRLQAAERLARYTNLVADYKACSLERRVDRATFIRLWSKSKEQT